MTDPTSPQRSPPHRTAVEICLDSVESAVAAAAGGAGRVELCDALVIGGTTPSHGMIEAVRRAIDIGLHVLVRPRGGDFLYSPAEIEVMRRDVEIAGELGADAVVLGVLEPHGGVDRERTRELIERARPMRVTFHRAFDMTADPGDALETLIDLGAGAVLTSGHAASAVEGAPLLRRLVERAAGRIEIIAAAGVTPENAGDIVARTGAGAVHAGSAVHVTISGAMRHRNSAARIAPGTAAGEDVKGAGEAAPDPGEARRRVSAALVRRLVEAAAPRSR